MIIIVWSYLTPPLPLTPPRSTEHLPNSRILFILNFKWSSVCAAHILSMTHFPGATELMKTDSPSLTTHQLSIAPQLRVGVTFNRLRNNDAIEAWPVAVIPDTSESLSYCIMYQLETTSWYVLKAAIILSYVTHNLDNSFHYHSLDLYSGYCVRTFHCSYRQPMHPHVFSSLDFLSYSEKNLFFINCLLSLLVLLPRSRTAQLTS